MRYPLSLSLEEHHYPPSEILVLKNIVGLSLVEVHTKMIRTELLRICQPAWVSQPAWLSQPKLVEIAMA